MCTKKIIISIILIISSSAILFSEEIIIGGSAGWERIRTIDTQLSEHAGVQDLQLADSEYEVTPSTEMLFHFNHGISDSRGFYSVINNHTIQISSSVSKKGSGSAVFTRDGTYLELIPAEAAAFAAGSGRLNDFSMEFWLNPARLSEGENIIQWSGAISTDGNTLQQEILCAVSDRNLFWELSNIFLTPELGPTQFTLHSSRTLIPKRWHHHMLRYDGKTGLLEYLIDGIPEDIVYTNAATVEDADIYYPIIGAAKPSRFMIGRGYTGFIDELRMTGTYCDPELNKYSMTSGTAITDIIDLEYYDSRFFQLESDSSLEGETQIYYYYRLSNKYFAPGGEYPRWNQFLPGEMLPPDVRGRYLQIMTELFPDGTGATTPVLSSMTISYDKNLPPMPPAYISVKAGAGKAILSWQRVTDSDIAGYKVYYGIKPGLYFGTGSITGSSPIDAGNSLTLQIEGLENGQLYYFAVTSYDNAEIHHESIFSREINTRPSAIIREN